ncbi:uncharacterized protein LOC126264135 [Aethina tumida]|uniref:uncharacterized protein LOC126264135 n=1 Tax=Aethina tumida TaxID=116153 RepID=UPI0021493FAD|nr:uncharacterized protein LOC126264135 [Aethina tumida]
MKEEVIVVSDDELPVRRKGPRITQVRGMVLNEKAKAKWDLTKFTGHMDYKTGRILYIVTESCRQDALTYVFANRNRIEDATEHLFYTANVMEAIVKEVHKGFKYLLSIGATT